MSWIQTYTGHKFSLSDPQPEDVYIDDVVAALGSICRFNGHCRQFYSVLQHSVHVAEVAEEANVVQTWDALMHDAAEAYFGDVTRPMRMHLNHISGGIFGRWKNRVERVVADALQLVYPMSKEVKHADNVMLATEARDLMLPPPEPWVQLPDPLPSKLFAFPSGVVRLRFLEMYDRYRPAGSMPCTLITEH
jgi:uncharacterized protein